MERFWLNKLKSPPRNEGSQQIHKQRNTHNLASDSSSFGCNSVKEYSTACELDRSSSKRVSGLPIKKLLAEEMSKELEATRRSPSVVARLMGFDGLPSQQPIHRQHKTSKQRTSSAVCEMRRNPYECQLYMENSKENTEFKDVYEVSEAEECVKANHSVSEMSFFRQKFMEAKRLSTGGKFHNSEQLCDTLDALETNKDLLIKFLHQPDSLYVRHIHDLQGPVCIPHCSQPVSERCRNKPIDLKSKKGTSRCDSRYHGEHHGNFSPDSYSPCSSNRSPQSSEIRLKEQHEKEVLPTRIVVLKPNLGKLQNPKKPVSLPRRHVEYPRNVSEGTIQSDVKPLTGDDVFSRPCMRKSRERAKEITWKMNKDLDNEQMKSHSLFQGYAGDESSYSGSGSDSGSEIEGTMISSKRSIHWINRRNATSSYALESSISREAKKRISKRWYSSQRYQDVGSVGEFRKLGEMLGKTDKQMRRDKLDRLLIPDISKDRLLDIMESGSPWGIDCKNGWKELYARNASKSGFVSDSIVSCYSPEPDQGGKLVSEELAYQDRNKAIKENFYIREDSPFQNQCSGNQNLQFRYKRGDGTKTLNRDRSDLNVDKNIASAKVSLVSRISGSNDNGTSLITEAKLDVEHEIKAFCRESPDEYSVKPSLGVSGINNSSASYPEDSKLQIEPAVKDLVPLESPVHHIQSLSRSKETNLLSPISVLEDSLTEDTSYGSECFERVSADLHELRIQLKLLRMESGEDGVNVMLSCTDNNQGSFSDIEENTLLEHTSWKTSYIDDILKESGFDSTNPNMILAIWHTLEYPIGPWVFDKIEKKYFRNKTTLKSDRRLLFDRINCGLAEVFWWLVNPHPWCATERRKFSLRWGENGVRYELEKLFSSEENDGSEKVLNQEMEWLDLEDEVDVIGQQLENILVNDLIDELEIMFFNLAIGMYAS